MVNRSFTKRSESDGWPGLICRWNHDTRPEYLLGTTRSGTLRPTPDDHGLAYECDLHRAAQRPGRDGSARRYFGFELRVRLLRGHMGLARWVPASHTGQRPDHRPGAHQRPSLRQASCSMRSLAEYAQVDVAEVRRYAEAGELGRFLKRSDLPSGRVPSTPLSRAEGKTRLRELGQVCVGDRHGRAAQLRKQLTAKQCQLELAAMTVDPVTQKPYGKPPTDKQVAVEKMRHKSSREKQLETYAAAPDWPVKGNTMTTNDDPHPSYSPPAISENMPGRFSYLRPGGVNAGFTGQRPRRKIRGRRFRR